LFSKWAKETSKTNQPKPCVVALYDTNQECTFVGKHFDAALMVGWMVKLHGKDKVSSLREEPFPPDVSKDPLGAKIMDSLVDQWLADVKFQNGKTPEGNEREGWTDFDPNVSPFVIGSIGDNVLESDAKEERDPSEMSEAELLDMRREGLFQSLNEAMSRGDEDTANALLKRLNQLGGRVTGSEDGDNLSV
jgi:hypothetical protein